MKPATSYFRVIGGQCGAIDKDFASVSSAIFAAARQLPSGSSINLLSAKVLRGGDRDYLWNSQADIDAATDVSQALIIIEHCTRELS